MILVHFTLILGLYLVFYIFLFYLHIFFNLFSSMWQGVKAGASLSTDKQIQEVELEMVNTGDENCCIFSGDNFWRRE